MLTHQIKPSPVPTPMDKQHIKLTPVPTPMYKQKIRAIPAPTPTDKQQIISTPDPPLRHTQCSRRGECIMSDFGFRILFRKLGDKLGGKMNFSLSLF